MLVLSQKKDGRVNLYIDGALIGSIANLSGGRIRLGFTLPSNVKVVRDEIDGKPLSSSKT